MERNDFDGLWSDPTNWTRAGFYRCAADPRLMVLKREGVGYTINIAHPRSWLVLGGLLAISLAPLVINLALGSSAPTWLFPVTLVFPIIVVVISLVWLSGRDGS